MTPTLGGEVDQGRGDSRGRLPSMCSSGRPALPRGGTGQADQSREEDRPCRADDGVARSGPVGERPVGPAQATPGTMRPIGEVTMAVDDDLTDVAIAFRDALRCR